MLTDELIHGLDPCPHVMFDSQRIEFARAIEAEALKEQSAKIAELERQLAEARKDAEPPEFIANRSKSQTDHELDAMKKYIEKITKDKDSAVAFLSRAGILDGSGELAEQYRNVDAAIKAKEQP